MHYLFLNWRDLKNPRSGGAEVVTEEIIKRLVLRGHTVTLFTSHFANAPKEEVIDGYTVIRRGREMTVHLWAFYHWFRHFRHQHFDIVVDQIHGIPFFTPLYVRNAKVVAFIHEVAREIWLHMYRFPIGLLGYTLEPLFFKPYKNTPFITVSKATKRDLEAVGIKPEHIHIIPEAVTTIPLPEIPKKDQDPTIVFVGRVAKMKGVGDLISAYRIAKETIPNLKLWIAGGGDTYKADLMHDCANDPDITFHGFVSEKEKISLYTRAHILASASIKEGFGLVVIEAAAHGTPAVVYNVDGFNEAVIDGKTGVLTNPRPQPLAEAIQKVLTNTTYYQELQKGAYEHSKSFSFDRTADEFEEVVKECTTRLSNAQNIYES
jgi:glycosyltransferase involved in cell wall biosynthesis